jgi:hypothetical protein
MVTQLPLWMLLKNPQPECDIYPKTTPRVLVTNTLQGSSYSTGVVGQQGTPRLNTLSKLRTLASQTLLLHRPLGGWQQKENRAGLHGPLIQAGDGNSYLVAQPGQW